MASKDESMQKQHMHAQREHAEWLEQLHLWRAEHQRALAQLARLQAAMMEHDADIEEHLSHIHRHEQHIGRHERTISAHKTNGGSPYDQEMLDGHGDFDGAHRELRAKLKRMASVHTDTVEVLEEATNRLHDIRDKFEGEALAEPSNEEVVHEAELESFPASDPPSFNPGHT